MILYLCHMTPDDTWPWALWVDHLHCQSNLPNHPTKSIPWICKGLYIGIWNEEERFLNLIVFIVTWSSITYECSNHKTYNMELQKHIQHHALWTHKPDKRTHKPDKRNPFSCPHMMMSGHGNISLVTGPLWGESIGDRWIPSQRTSNTDFGVFMMLS